VRDRRRVAGAASSLASIDASCDSAMFVRMSRSPLQCEMCALPYQEGATTCDGCDHRLGTAPDLDALRLERKVLKRRLWLGFAAASALVLVNVLVFQGAGIVLIAAPFGLMIHSYTRLRAVSAHLRASDA
jgi:hypothetical protein